MSSKALHDQKWGRQKMYRDRNLLDYTKQLSTISIDNNRQEIKPVAETGTVRNDLREESWSPLPELIIEVEPNKHDEPQEFYDELAKRMKIIYRKLFIENQPDESDSHYSESRDLSHNLDTKDIVDHSHNLTTEEETDSGKLLSKDEHNVPHERARKISSTKNSTSPHVGDMLIESDDTEHSVIKYKKNKSSFCSSPMLSYRQVTTRAEVHPYPKDTVPQKGSRFIHEDAKHDTTNSNEDIFAGPTDGLLQLEKPNVSDIENHHRGVARESVDVEVMRRSRAYMSTGSIPYMEETEDRQRKSIHDTEKLLTQHEYAMSHSSTDSTPNFMGMEEQEEATNSEILHTSVFAEDSKENIGRNETQKRKNSSPIVQSSSLIKKVKKCDVGVQTSTTHRKENLPRLNNPLNYIFAETPQLHRVCPCPRHKY